MTEETYLHARARILSRLEHGARNGYPVCGFYHRDDQEVLATLAEQGRVRTWPGDGRDWGLVLAVLRDAAATQAVRAVPSPPPGGAA